jgi:hypothetical protein
MFICILFACGFAFAETTDPGEEQINVEDWIIGRIETGKVADLAELFPDEMDKEKRVISYDFLDRLLTNPGRTISIHRRGVRLENAIFNDPIDFEHAEIPYEVVLKKCSFRDDVSFSKSHFLKSVDFNRSEFFKKADFSYIKVDGNVGMYNGKLRGAVDFLWAEILGIVDARYAKFMSDNDPVSFNSADVGGAVFFGDAEFAGPVNFIKMTVGASFDASRITFKSEKMKANLNSMKVGGSAFFNDALTMKVGKHVFIKRADFEGAVSFIRAEMDGNFEANGAWFKSKVDKVSFNSMKVAGAVFLRGFNTDNGEIIETQFDGPVDFIKAEVSGSFDAKGAIFVNSEQGVSFSGIRIGSDTFLDGTQYSGPVNFVKAEIGGNLEASRAQFNGVDKEVTFNSMKVGGAVFFKETQFKGPVDFVKAEVSGSFDAYRANFEDTKKGASFSGIRIGSDAFIDRTHYAGPVNFIKAEIEGNLEANGSQFNGIDKNVTFNSMKVGGSSFFNGYMTDDGQIIETMFKGPVDFVKAEVSGTFNMLGAIFENQEEEGVVMQEVSFSGIKIGSDVFFENNSFEVPADFSYLETSENLIIRGSHFHKSAVFNNIMAGTNAMFENAIFDQDLDLSQTDIRGEMKLEGIRLPDPLNHEIRLDGMRYNYVSKTSWSILMEMVEKSVFNANVYENLEAFFMRQGAPDWADKVFVSRKVRQRKEVLSRIEHFPSYLGNIFLYIFVHYGRSPERAFGWGVLIVLIGCIVFRKREGMELQSPSDSPPRYHPLWYSFDLFLPFVNLQSAGVWMPRQDRKFARHYMRVHTLLGWLLIPVGLAALTGIIK